MATPNAARAYAVLDEIDADPDSHDQQWWFIRTECGTTACFAGRVCIQAGGKPDFGIGAWATSSGSVVMPDGRIGHAGAIARELLGIDLMLGERLFRATNTRAALGRMVAEIFGPRPEPAPPAGPYGVADWRAPLTDFERRAGVVEPVALDYDDVPPNAGNAS